MVKSIGETLNEDTTYPASASRKIEKIRTAIDKHKALCELADKPFLAADVEDIVTGIVSPDKKPKSLPLLDALKRYKSALVDGSLLRDGKRAGKSTINALGYAISFIEGECEEIGDVPIEKFNTSHVGKLVAKMLELGYAQNTVSHYINAVLFFFQFTYKVWHRNPVHKEDDVFEPHDTIDYAIYYKTDEIMKLYSLELTGLHELARDMFVYGCHTCMRYSDHNSHSEVNITPDYIVLSTIKRGTSVTIPLHHVVKEILKKYGGKPPKLGLINFNKAIKLICRDAKGEDGKYLFRDKVVFQRVEGGKKIKRIMERWMLTSSHTMRRSFATNALLAGVPEEYIKRIGGWKSQSSFDKYKRATNLDIAKAASQHPFFSGKTA